ncbi:MAG: Gfo/Idh/MocA family oxidoreductase [Marinilabiliaceae bacterium]|nr:Gfo/Idh/MocA family oxidoreductase [Marinilabiliaceae bacterium]
MNWGIIGCGDVTEKKSGPAFNCVEGSRVMAVMRRNYELAKDYAIRHKVPKYYDDADALINDTTVNAVYVATPPESHAIYAIKAMEAGKPVYVEKPMAMNYEECSMMVETSRKTRMPLFVAYYRRTLPGFLKVRELINDGIIGKVLTVNIQLFKVPLPEEMDQLNPSWRVVPSIAGAGLFFDLASHQLDYLDFIFGPIVSYSGHATNRGCFYKAEDTVVASFVFENGVVGVGNWSFVVNESSQRDVIQIHGTKGYIEFSCFGHLPVKLFTKEGVIDFPFINPEYIQYNLIKQVVEQLQGEGSCVSTGETAARTTKVLEAIVKEYYS